MLYRQILIFYDFSIFLLLPLNNSSLLKWVNLNDRFNLHTSLWLHPLIFELFLGKLKRSFQFTHYTTKRTISLNCAAKVLHIFQICKQNNIFL